MFRLGSNIPVPGIDPLKLSQFFSSQSDIYGIFDLMSGGAFKKLSIFALGISPYITASIIMNLLQIAIPYFENLAKEGEAGRKKMIQFTRYGTVILSLIQATGMSYGLFRSVYRDFGFQSVAVTVIVLTAGTAFLMYLGEKINENGIGNGISLFIFAGILSRVPLGTRDIIVKTFGENATISPITVGIFVLFAVLVIAGVIFMQLGSRKIPVQYAKRVVGRKMYGGHSTHIPLKVNMAGVIPVIFAISLLMFPQTVAQFVNKDAFKFLQANFSPNSINVWGVLLYNAAYIILIVGFTFFYTQVTFNPLEVAENMKKNGGFIPGIRPGKPTSDYLMQTLNRLTLAGGLFLALVAVLPNLLYVFEGFKEMNIQFGGTALLIAVGVSMDTLKQIEAQMVMRHYQGFLK